MTTKKTKSNPQARISSTGELLLYGEIGSWFDDNDAGSVLRDLEKVSKNEALTVRIHSEGGYVTEGLAIYNQLKSHPKDVHIIIDGIAASMASVVAMAGDKVYMPENSFMMIHSPWAGVVGDAEDMRKTADTLDSFEKSLISIYSKKTGMDEETLKDMLVAETWLSSSDALSLGFIDEIIEPIKAAACIDLSKFASPPKFEFDFRDMKSDYKDMKSEDFNISSQNQETPMTDKIEKPEVVQAKETVSVKAEAPKVDVKAAIEAERKRIADIQAIGAKASLSSDQIQKMIDSDVSVADAKAAAFEFMVQNDAKAQPRSTVVTVEHNMDNLTSSMKNALMNRVNPQKYKLDDKGREFRGMSLMDMAKAALATGGINWKPMTQSEIAIKALHSTSDFPLLLADVANKSMRDAYEAAPKTFAPLARQVSVADFKTIRRLQLGEAPALAEIKESGEYTYGTLSENQETYSLTTYGKMINLSRKTLINDDLDAFTRIASAFGVQAARKEADIVWALITDNGAMSDGNNLFDDTNHLNHTSTGTAITVASLGVGREKMRKQKGIDAATYLNLRPEYLVVPVGKETLAQQYTRDISPTQGSEVNPFSGAFKVIAEPRLDDNSSTAWYMFASPSVVDTIEYAYLSGNEGVYLETQETFNVDGVTYKARLDFGAGVIDYRGMYKNNGA